VFDDLETGHIIEVPFSIYRKYCSPCMYNAQLLTPLREYLEMLSLIGEEESKVKLKCSAPEPCTATNVFKSTEAVSLGLTERQKRILNSLPDATRTPTKGKERGEDSD
jgi:hypothetical protein